MPLKKETKPNKPLEKLDHILRHAKRQDVTA